MQNKLEFNDIELSYINKEPVLPPEQEETAAKYLYDVLRQDLAKGHISAEWLSDLTEYERIGSRTARKILVVMQHIREDK